MAVDKDTLLKLKVSAKKITIEGVGEFEYRGLSRNEAIGMHEIEGGVQVQDAELFALCVLDPKLTREEWSELADQLPASLLEPLSTAIAEASGADVGAAKASYKRFRG
jgi:hypothetical protein